MKRKWLFGASAIALIAGGALIAHGQGSNTSPLLNDFGIALSPNEQNQSADIGTATTSDLVPILDVSETPDSINYGDGANILEMIGTTATSTEINYLDITTLGTGAASKAVVLDASGDYTYPATGTIIYPSSATLTLQSGSTFNAAGTFQIGGTTVSASAAEINRAADVSARVVNITTTPISVVEATHEGKIVTLNKADGIALTLPEATGGGGIYRLVVGTTATASITITTADTDNAGYIGQSRMEDADGDFTRTFYPAASLADDIITLNGGTTCGKAGTTVTLIDVATDTWQATIECGAENNAPATPFSSTA